MMNSPPTHHRRRRVILYLLAGLFLAAVGGLVPWEMRRTQRLWSRSPVRNTASTFASIAMPAR